MFNIGPQELLLILLVALVVVGPKRLPELSRSIGKGLRELRKAQDEVRKTITLNLDESEPTAPGRGRAPTPASEEAGAAAAAKPEASEGDTQDIARTLGRGLAEIRRTRQEIQRSFRVDLSDAPRGTRPTPPRATPPASAPPVAGPSEAGTPGEQTPADPMPGRGEEPGTTTEPDPAG